EQAGGVERVGGHDDAEAGDVREQDFAALAVVDGAAVQVSADGHADDRGAGELAVAAPAHGGELVAELHHGGPNVIEELNFGDRLHAAAGHADGAAHDGGFGEGRIEAAARAELHLQAGGDFEDAALSFDFAEAGFAAAIGDIFAEDHHARIAAHLFAEGGVEQVHHSHGRALEAGLGAEGVAGGVDGFGVEVAQ